MTDDADIGYGAEFQRGNGADPEVFTSIGEVVDVVLPKLSRDVVDATHSKSPGAFREFIPGLRQQESFSVEVHYDEGSATMAALRADFGSDAPVNYRVLFPGGDIVDFAGFVTGLDIQTPTAGKKVVMVDIQPTGAGTVTVA